MRAADRAAARFVLAVAAALGTLLGAGSARADGAFPDSQVILTPADLPNEIILVTNFGLIASEDGGATWLWSCEGIANMYGAYYQLGLGPRHRLYTLVDERVMFSDDRACGWTASGGLLADAGGGVGASDFWVDRTVVDRVLAVDVTCCDGNQRRHAVIASRDGGARFDDVLYQAPLGAMITGVESARSSPDTLYVTLQGGPVDGGRPPPVLAHTVDLGQSWSATDLTAALGPGTLRLIAIDPADPRRVFLLWSDVDGQALALSTDGGAMAHKILTPAGVMKSFLRLESGTLLVATDDSSVAGLYRSRDGGATFEPVPDPPHVRALSERAGTVFAATDNFGEGYAIGVSTDEGATWRPLLAYEDVRGILPCVKAACQVTCDAEVQLSLWPAAVCSADPPASSGTGATDGGNGGGGTPGPGTGGLGGSPAPGNARGTAGCGCHAASGSPPTALALLVLLVCRRRSRPSAAPGVRDRRSRARTS